MQPQSMLAVLYRLERVLRLPLQRYDALKEPELAGAGTRVSQASPRPCLNRTELVPAGIIDADIVPAVTVGLSIHSPVHSAHRSRTLERPSEIGGQLPPRARGDSESPCPSRPISGSEQGGITLQRRQTLPPPPDRDFDIRQFSNMSDTVARGRSNR